LQNAGGFSLRRLRLWTAGSLDEMSVRPANRGGHQFRYAIPNDREGEPMTSPDTATLLEDAADRIADISRADLQIMLRRAALRLRNAGAVSMEDDVEEALRDLASEFGMTRNDTIRFIVREWMEKNTYLPVHNLDEDGDVDGTA
jgi:macrodomain Ter protein organizer (MatP/YcbG family)